MKTLTANAEAQRTAAYHQPRWIVEIDWSNDGTWSGKYADQPLTIGADTYDDYVQEWSDLRLHLDYQNIGSTDDLKIVMKNDDTEAFWKLAVTNDAEGKPVRLGLWFAGTGSADIIWMFQGEIKAIAEHSLRGTTLDIVEFGRKKQKPLPLREVNRDRFPIAPYDAVGRMIPIVYGKVPRCPGIPVVGYTVPRLYGPHSETDTTIRLTTLEDIPSSGTVFIDNEQIKYTGTTSTYVFGSETVSALTGCTRGYNSTTAVVHEDGAEVFAPNTHYYLFADHACDAIFIPTVNGQPPASNYIKTKAGTLFARSGARAGRIEFVSRPPLYREFDKATETFKVMPNATAFDNGAINPANAYSDIEDSNFATVDSINRPLSVDQTASLSAHQDEKGAIKKARLVVEYETSENFLLGDITADIANI